MQNTRNIFFSPHLNERVRSVVFRVATMLSLLGSLLLARPVEAQSVYENYTFVTLAGPAGTAGSGSADGPDAAARFSNPIGIARDAGGNLYVVDQVNNVIRKITPAGFVTTLAGLAGVAGTNDGVGAAARFNSPFGIAIDSNTNLYVAENGNDTIRKISLSGVVTTFAGAPGVSGSANGTLTTARFSFPTCIAVDASNNVYVADTGNNTIRKITPAGQVTTLAGQPGSAGQGSRDGTGAIAQFNQPTGIGVDATGNIYVTDSANDTIRKITSKGAVTTLAGAAGISGTDDGTNDTARFSTPDGITVDSSGNIYVADTFNHTIRFVTPAGVVTTLVGSAGHSGSLDSTNTAALFHFPIAIAIDQSTNLFVVDFGNDAIRQVTASLAVTTLAGQAGGLGSVDATGSAARFNFPAALALDSSNDLYVADFDNETIREITPAGVVTTLAGVATVSGTNDGVGSAARFSSPLGVAVDQNGNVLVADSANDEIREISPQGSVSTLAGISGQIGASNGTVAVAQFDQPFDVAVDTNGNVFVADTHNNAIREITPDGNVTTFAGLASPLISGTNDGVGTNAQFNFPSGLAVDANNNVFVADRDNFTIREITPGASVSTFAGIPGTSGSADGVGSAATFNFPFGVAVDASGNVYVGDTGNTIRKITPAGTVTTIAGLAGQTGNLDGTGSDARFDAPEGVAVDSQGNVYVADAANQSIRKGYPSLPDMPTVDLIGAHVGVRRNFAIANQTTTSWSWSLIRQPANSSAQLVGTNTANPTFTPDVEDIYVIQFQGWDNSGHTTIRRMTLYADDTPPGITITNPATGTISSNGVFTVAGTTTDNLGVSNVFVQINGGPWTNATGTTNWAVDAALIKGTNTILAYAQDFAGNVSQTNEIRLPFIVSGRLVAFAKGGGKLRPDLNGVLLQIGSTYSITAKPVPGSTFSGWSANLGAGTNSETITFVMQSNLTLTANFIDHQNPTLKITSPRNAVFLSNATFTVAGTAKDNDNVANVSYELNGGVWTNAVGTNNWTAQVNLTPGANTVLAYAQDPSGNRSTTNRAILTYVPSAQMTINKTGQGTVSPNFSGSLLAIGTNFSMTARAAAGFIFSNWVDTAGNLLSSSPTYSFTMMSNTTVGVNFSPNLMFNAQGSYAGLFFDTNNLTATNAGFFSAAVTPTGAFTAKMLLGGSTISTSGQFSPEGVFSNSVVAKGFSNPFTIQLQLDLTGGDQMTGTIANSGWSAPLIANQDIFSTTNPPSQSFERFTLVIPGGPDSSIQPGGSSFGSIIIDGTGNVTFSGTLADGSPASQQTFISKDGQWPFYISSSSGQGVMLGWLTFSQGRQGTLDGQVYWQRLPFDGAKLYPGGFNFTNGIETTGSFYDFFIGVPTLVLPTNGGTAILQQGGLSPALTNSFTLSTHDIASGTNNFKTTIAFFTGVFKGSIINPENKISIPFNGVVLTNQNAGFGYFISGGQSGSVFIGTNAPPGH